MGLANFVGQVIQLQVARITSFGYFLTDGKEDILLHQNDTDEQFEEGEKIDVFIYMDNEGRAAATTFLPNVEKDKYGWGTAREVKPSIGVFIDIGIKKDILLGKEDLPKKKEVWPEEGDQLYITLRVSKHNRIYAKLASDAVIEEIRLQASEKDFNKNIEGYVYRTAKVGSWIYTLEGFKGFIHESERGEEPRLGQRVKGRIIDVKEDGTVNVSLLPRKHEAQETDAEKIFAYLQSRNGAMPYWDKSLPEEIEERFQMSKGAFKRALGKLMKEGKIYQEEGWTYIKK